MAVVLLVLAGVAGVELKAELMLSSFQEERANVIFEQLNDKNGLGSPVVTAFAEDHDGFLWVGTQGGLQRWDGYRFWTYKTVLGDARSLPDNFVNVLYTDRSGRLWVGTNSGGLARYDRESDQFVRYRSDSKDLSRVSVRAIIDDEAGGLWVGSDTGLDHLETATGVFTHLALAKATGDQPEARRATSVLRTADGSLWVGTELGLERSLPGALGSRVFQRVLLPLPHDAAPGVTSLFLDRAGRIWVGTHLGVYLIAPGPDGVPARRTRSGQTGTPANGAQHGTALPELQARLIPVQGPDGDLLSSQRILSIAGTARDEIWMGTQDQGIFAVNPKTWDVRQISHNPGLPSSIADDWVQTLYLGKPGLMWAGTRRGVSYADTTPKAVLNFLGGAGPGESIADTDVYSVVSRRNGSIWLGLSKHGIDILDSTGHRTGQLRPKTGAVASKTMLPEGTISSLSETANGRVYICTQDGVYRTDGEPDKTGAQKLVRVPLGAAAAGAASQTLSDNGVLWVAGSDGLWTLDPEDGPGPAKRPLMQHPLTDQRVTVLKKGPGDSLWIGTQNGLNLLNLKTRAVEAILPDPTDATALSGSLIATLLTDRRGRLWVGTFGGGIDVLEGRDENGKPRFRRIVEGLPNETIDMLLEAPDGKIWVSTDGGLAVVDPVTFETHILYRADGAFMPAYWDGVGTVTAAGELLFGGLGGLTVVRPELVKPWSYQPPVVVTSARIGNTDVPLSRFNSGMDVYPVWIPADQNNLTVEFSALDYTSPERNRYEYKLEGFDHEWVSADPTRRLVRYTNLSPGDYVLMLRGSNRDGAWAPTRQVRIRVLPAWFQTLWFRSLMVLAGVLLLCGVFLLGTAYLRRQQRQLERQVALRTAELRQMTVELQDSQQKLKHMAYTDSLTGLPNRRMFTEHFRRLLALKRRQEGSFALLLMDFDDFKEINDTFGHDAGDAVLNEMARRMSALVRESDCLARLGGDEFGLLLSESPGVDGTDMVCRKIVESFIEPVHFQGHSLKTTPSIGVAMYPNDGDSQDKLYKMADLAMYQAKRDGGNGCSWIDSSAAEMQDASSLRSEVQ
jgi:diguanylate cyclase (GGDEF)-like protein